MSSPEATPRRRPGRPAGAQGGEGRAALLRAARELMGEKGFPRVTAREVAERAGVSRGHDQFVYKGSHGFVAGHVSPEAAVGGPIALIEDGDVITFDAEKRRIDISIDEEELDRRKSGWTRPRSDVKTGALAKYRAEASSASEGAVTTVPAWDD